MKYAVIKLGGHQYKVSEGDTFEVDRLDKEGGKSFVISEVLLVADGEDVKIGTPLVKGSKVKLQLVEQTRSPKIPVRRFRAKSRYRRNKSHRQPLSVVKVEKIVEGK